MIQEHGVYVEFFMHPVEMRFESQKAGRPVFKDVPHVRLVTPGDRNNQPVFIATDDHKQKYRQAWRAFEENDFKNVVGTPLSMLPGLAQSQAKEAEYFNVHTIEQMAEVSDSAIMNMGIGFRDVRERSKAYLSSSDQRAVEAELREQNASLQAQIDEMRALMVGEAALSDDSAPEKRGPGRPPKAKE